MMGGEGFIFYLDSQLWGRTGERDECQESALVVLPFCPCYLRLIMAKRVGETLTSVGISLTLPFCWFCCHCSDVQCVVILWIETCLRERAVR